MDVNPLKVREWGRNVLFTDKKLSVRTLSPLWLRNEREEELRMTDIRDANWYKDKQSKLRSSFIQGIFHIVNKWHFGIGWGMAEHLAGGLLWEKAMPSCTFQWNLIIVGFSGTILGSGAYWVSSSFPQRWNPRKDS